MAARLDCHLRCRLKKYGYGKFAPGRHNRHQPIAWPRRPLHGSARETALKDDLKVMAGIGHHRRVGHVKMLAASPPGDKTVQVLQGSMSTMLVSPMGRCSSADGGLERW